MGADKEQEAMYSANKTRFISYEELKKHNKPDDRWLLIENKVYNITTWAKKHPGGAKILGHFSGEDATVRTNKLIYAFSIQKFFFY